MDGRLKLKEEELVGQGKGTLLQRTSSGQQTVDQKRQLPQKPTCQPLQSNALQDSGEDSLTTTEKGSRQLLSCGTTVKEEINRFGQTQIDSAFVDTSRRCGYSGAAKKVVWLKAKKKKLIVRTDERERSLLLKERWLMMVQVRLTWTLIRIEAALHQHKISWPEESTIHITSSPTIYWQGCHDLSSRNANLYDADPRTPQPASIFNRGSSANRSNAN
ncbi:hypothetical protein pipiens_009955 [Culex pipiens pipiens]|uniref:Uncharacterized protein n=1 Tax=Culex pipiens pipiens TaxID=38569 RepID=A0ABD1DBY6_CULPP